ncbi:heat shock 70 kDa protein 1-like [Styela clava]
MNLWAFTVENDDNKPKMQVVHSHEKNIFCPEQISAMVLKEMKVTAEACLGETVTDAVITVPAYFHDAQRKATNDAGVIAGLNVIGIINEPTAAAIAYGLDKEIKNQRDVLIVDLGGGTFDVTIVKIEGRKFYVTATGGDTHLRGEDFDNILVEYFVSEFKQQHASFSNVFTPSFRRRVCVKAPNDTCYSTFYWHRESWRNNAFCYSAKHEGSNQDMANLAYRERNQTTATFKIYEGERTFTKDNHFLDTFTISGIPPASRNKEIIVLLEINACGILHVKATEEFTGNSSEITIARDKGRLSESEIKRMVQEAEKFRKRDQELKQRSGSRNSLEDYAYSLKNGLEQKISNTTTKKIYNEQND